MSMSKLPARIVPVVVIALFTLTLVGPARASANAEVHLNSAAAKPSGYVIVNSGALASPPSQVASGAATCPSHTLPLGGGVLFSSDSVHATIENSFPWDHGWAADVTNGTTLTATFYVYAVCGTKPTGWRILQSGVRAIAAHTQQDNVTINCSAGKPLSGGDTFGLAGIVATSLNGSLPTSTGWRVDLNNGSGSTEEYLLTMLCATLTGYHIVVGPAVSNPAGAQNGSTVLCGTGVPIGGGALSSSSSTVVAMNTSYPVTGGWSSYLSNGSGTSATFHTYVVCAT